MSSDGSVRIAISGKSGCGNSTVSRLVAGRLGVRLINYTFHSVAEERGMTFDEVCRLAEEDSSWDVELDKRQVQMARQGSCVLGSRLAVWLLEDADLKIYLTAPSEVRAGRIQKREGGAFEDVLSATLERDRRDRERYLNLYNIDIDKFEFVDIVIDTTAMSQEEEADIIVDEVNRHVGRPTDR